MAIDVKHVGVFEVRRGQPQERPCGNLGFVLLLLGMQDQQALKGYFAKSFSMFGLSFLDFAAVLQKLIRLPGWKALLLTGGATRAVFFVSEMRNAAGCRSSDPCLAGFLPGMYVPLKQHENTDARGIEQAG